MADGTGQAVYNGFLIFVNMSVGVGNPVGMEIGVVMFVVMLVLVVMRMVMYVLFRHGASLFSFC